MIEKFLKNNNGYKAKNLLSNNKVLSIREISKYEI